jgi:hypothetical protein
VGDGPLLGYGHVLTAQEVEVRYIIWAPYPVDSS